MSWMPDSETLTLWLLAYGNMTLFFLLALGIIALPVPEETLLVLTGYLIAQGKLDIPQAPIAAFLGSIFGITTSYFLGRWMGKFLLRKGWFGLKQAHIDKAEAWFERVGKWILVIGYFIPGVRHFTGFSTGMATLPYHHFALFAYSGALIWVSTFLSLGYFFGHQCLNYCKEMFFTS